MAPQASDQVVVCQPYCHSFKDTPSSLRHAPAVASPPAPVSGPISLYRALEVDCETSVSCPKVISALASILNRTITANDALGRMQTTQLTVFHGMSAPAITIAKYLERVLKYSNSSPSCFVLAHIYMERLLRKQRGLQLTSLTVHRLVVTSLMVAAKFYEDDFYNNGYYARVGGLPTSEMNRLELEFLLAIDFRLAVTTDEFVSHCDILLSELLYVGAVAPVATLAFAGDQLAEAKRQADMEKLQQLLSGQEQTEAEAGESEGGEREEEGVTKAMSVEGRDKSGNRNEVEVVECVVTVDGGKERVGERVGVECAQDRAGDSVAVHVVVQCSSNEEASRRGHEDSSVNGLLVERSMSREGEAKRRAADAFSWAVPGSTDELHYMHTSYGAWGTCEEADYPEDTEEDDYCGEVLPDYQIYTPPRDECDRRSSFFGFPSP